MDVATTDVKVRHADAVTTDVDMTTVTMVVTTSVTMVVDVVVDALTMVVNVVTMVVVDAVTMAADAVIMVVVDAVTTVVDVAAVSVVVTTMLEQDGQVVMNAVVVSEHHGQAMQDAVADVVVFYQRMLGIPTLVTTH